MTIELTYTMDGEDMVVDFDNHAEMFAFCLAEETTFENGTCTLEGLRDDETELLKQAIEAAARGRGNYVRMYANGHSEIDGN